MAQPTDKTPEHMPGTLMAARANPSDGVPSGGVPAQ